MAKTKSVLEESVRLGAKHQVTIPHRISKALRLRKGDHMLMRLVGRRVELIPASLRRPKVGEKPRLGLA